MNKRRIRKAIRRLSHLPRNRYLFHYLFNKGRHYMYKLTRSTKVAYPSVIMLELTNRCNLACTTCAREYGYGKAMDQGAMPINEAKKVIDQLWPYLDGVVLTGMGETFLYKELEEIVDYIKGKNQGIIISVSTNAQVPRFNEAAQCLVGKLGTIQISIDGIGEVYESIRKNGNFEKLHRNLTNLAEVTRNSTTDLTLNMVVTRENHMQMADMVKYASKTGIQYLNFNLMNLAAVTDIPELYYEFYRSEPFRASLAELRIAAAQHPEVHVTDTSLETTNGFRHCPFPWTHYYICWDGFVAPCCAKPFPKEMHFGNVMEKPLIEILNSKAYRSFRTLWQKNTTPSFCKKCTFIDSCAS